MCFPEGSRLLVILLIRNNAVSSCYRIILEVEFSKPANSLNPRAKNPVAAPSNQHTGFCYYPVRFIFICHRQVP